MLIKTNKLNKAGDTIVEVLIAIVITTLVCAVAYEIAIKSSLNTQNTQERTQALQYVQNQVELLNQTPADAADFNSTVGDTCFSPVDSGSNQSPSNNNCTSANPPKYNILVSCTTTSPTNCDITATWPSPVNGTTDKVEINYEP